MTEGDVSCFTLGEPPCLAIERLNSIQHWACLGLSRTPPMMQEWNSKNTYRSGKQAAQVTRASWLTSLKVKLTQPSQRSLLREEETCGSNITPVKEAKNKWSGAGRSWISDLIRTAAASEWCHLPPTQATAACCRSIYCFVNPELVLSSSLHRLHPRGPSADKWKEK